jgi:hypothetical protein
LEEVIAKQQPVDPKVVAAFINGDVDTSGGLDPGEIVKVFEEQLGFLISRRELEARVRVHDEDRSGFLDFQEFEDLWRRLFEIPAVRDVFDAYASNGVVSTTEFVRFIRTELQLKGDEAWVKKNVTERDFLTFAEFCRFLMNPDLNSLVDPDVLNRPDPMTYPIAHYFIASSHNTYLEEDQLKGKSSAWAYTRCLDQNCKCLELDLWDGPDGVPEITHGHTLCGKVSVTDVCQAIMQYVVDHQMSARADARAKCPPIILSLENHLCTAQQDKLAEIFSVTFGNRLPPAFDRTPGAQLPSPSDLSGLVLLKGGICDEANPPPDKSALLSRMIHLGTYGCPKKATTFETKPAFMMFSASESKLKKFAKNPESLRNLQQHNSVHLTRSYPKGSRVGSSNYDPCPGWMTGSQLVALNYQTPSEPMWLNDAKFTMNAGIGYVLKPPYIIDPSIPPPYATAKLKYTVHVLRGAGFPSTKTDVIDPYIELKVLGWKDDTRRERTKAISNNGIDPIFTEKWTFEFAAPEMDIFCVYLWDGGAGGDGLVGHFLCPVLAMRAGLHSVPLIDGSREKVRLKGASLLLKVIKEQ